MSMMQVADRLGLTMKSLDIVDMGAAHYFDGYLALHLFIPRQVNLRHTTPAQSLFEVITT